MDQLDLQQLLSWTLLLGPKMPRRRI